MSFNTISNIKTVLLGFSIEFVQAKLLLLLRTFPLLLFLWELDAPLDPGSKRHNCGLSRWLMIFLTRRLCHQLSGSFVRFKRRNYSHDPGPSFCCLSNTRNIGGTSRVFWIVTFASIHSAKLFANESLASFPAQHIGRDFKEEEEAGNIY